MSIIEASTLPRGRNMYRKPKTNADRIRAMTDEELADFICKTQFAFIPRSLGNIPISVYDGMSVLEWLKQEADT